MTQQLAFAFAITHLPRLELVGKMLQRQQAPLSLFRLA